MPLSPKARADAQLMIAELERRRASKFYQYFPDTGPFRRELYGKFLEFFAAGSQHRERLLMAANRVGKTMAGAYEDVCHLTGKYPPWWVGRRFALPIDAWIAGDTSKTTRDILQTAILGPPGQPSLQGTGMLPAHLVIDTTPKQGIPDAIETVFVRHSSGGVSTCTFKSYDQRREAFQGTAKHLIHLDEEVDDGIYTECLLRTMETSDFAGGLVILTFTPLMGMTPLILTFLPTGKLETAA